MSEACRRGRAEPLQRLVDPASLRVNGSVEAAASFPGRIGDFDRDGIPDMEVRFDRAAAIASASARSASAVLSISGTVAGDPFVGEFQVTINSK